MNHNKLGIQELELSYFENNCKKINSPTYTKNEINYSCSNKKTELGAVKVKHSEQIVFQAFTQKAMKSSHLDQFTKEYMVVRKMIYLFLL